MKDLVQEIIAIIDLFWITFCILIFLAAVILSISMILVIIYKDEGISYLELSIRYRLYSTKLEGIVKPGKEKIIANMINIGGTCLILAILMIAVSAYMK